MQVKFHTIRYPHGFYLNVKDDDGADATFLMLPEETEQACLERNMREQLAKIAQASKNADRMSKWLVQMTEKI